MSGGTPPGHDAGPDGWDFSGSIHSPTGHLERYPGITFDEEIEVATQRLDDWAAQAAIGDIDFIWADVQGAERDLIAGGLNTFRRTRIFYTEYSNEELYEGQIDLDGILNLLPEFRIVARYPNDGLLRNALLS